MTKTAQRARRRRGVEWPTIGLIVLCYSAWIAAGLFLCPIYPVSALAVMAFMLALQSSIGHEVLHGHPTRSTFLNEAFVFLPIGITLPFRRYKWIHLRHHADERLTDPLDDPESYYRAFWQHAEMPKPLQFLLRVNNTMLGRFILGPWLSCIGFFAGESGLLWSGEPGVRKAWLLHAAGLAIVIPLVSYGFGIPFWLYLLVPVWAGQSLISIRTFAEHQWSEDADGRSIIIEKTLLSLLFLNNNLHFVHHKNPTVAWYRLPRLFKDRREEWISLNGGYVLPNYWALLRSYAFRTKEPVVHPILRRASDSRKMVGNPET